MNSIFWGLIESKPTKFSKGIIYVLLVLGITVFSLPRINEAWGIYGIIFYPAMMVIMLELIKRVLQFLSNIRTSGTDLVENEDFKNEFDNWWGNISKRNHYLLSISVALFLSIVSLIFNANLSWTRYTDALGIFYLGLTVGETTSLLSLVPFSVTELKKYSLKLNPVDPSNTNNFRSLADTIFSLALLVGLALLFLNLIGAVAAFIFPHLKFGVYFITAIAWITFIGLAAYPHFTLREISETQKFTTLQTLENKLIDLYKDVIEGDKGHSSLDVTLNLYNSVLNSKAFPTSNSALFGVIATLFLNSIPVIIEFFIR